MPSRWIGCIHKGQVAKRWSLREKTDRYDDEDKSCNPGRQEYHIRFHVEFLTEPAKEEWPSSVARVRVPTGSTGAR